MEKVSSLGWEPDLSSHEAVRRGVREIASEMLEE
jgi:UDP-glucose 4-epimerase